MLSREHIVVFVQGDEAKIVAASAHGDYDTKNAADVRWDGTHPKIVYHKDGGSTHAFRFASATVVATTKTLRCCSVNCERS